MLVVARRHRAQDSRLQPEGRHQSPKSVLWSSKAAHYQSLEAVTFPRGRLTLTGESVSFTPSRARNMVLRFYVLLPGFRRLLNVPEWHCPTNSVVSFAEVANPWHRASGPWMPDSTQPVMRVVIRGQESQHFLLQDVPAAIRELQTALHLAGFG